MRRLILLLTVGLSILSSTTVAVAGGAIWEPEGYDRPGDIVGGWGRRVLPGEGGRSAQEAAEEVRPMVASMPLIFDQETTASQTVDEAPARVPEPSDGLVTTWLVAASVVSAALVVGMVRSNLRYWSRARTNDPEASGVSIDERVGGLE